MSRFFRLIGPLLFALSCGLALSRTGPQLRALEADEYVNPAHITTGEALLHGLAPNYPQVERDLVARCMPFGGLVEALLVEHLDGLPRRAAFAALVVLQLALVYALAALLAGPPEGLAAAGLFAASGWGDYTAQGSVQFVYSLQLGVVALALARLALRPSNRARCAAGLAVGASLLGRSPLAFLPPVLAALDRRREGARFPRAALLGLLPYAFLIPWIAMNWSLQRQFIPFEYQEADAKIAAAAMGGVDAGQHVAFHELADPPDASKSGSVLLWAARRVAAHPAAYLAGYAARVRLALGWHGLPLILAMLGVWRFRREAAFRAVGLLIAYFFLVYCAIAVHPTYFQPLPPIAIAVAAAAVGRALRGSAPAPDFARAGATLAVAGGGMLVLSAATLALVCGYGVGFGADDEAAVRRELKRHPDDPWLRSRLGQIELAAGRVDDARRELDLAASLRPRDPLRRWEAAAAALRQGQPGPALALEDEPVLQWTKTDLLKILAFRKAGKPELARELWAKAARLDASPRAEDLRRAAGEFVGRYLPESERPAAGRFLSELAGTPIETTVEPPLAGGYPHLMALRAQNAGRYEDALRLYEKLALEHGHDARLALDRGVLFFLMGRRWRAVEQLRKAVALDPSSAHARASLAAALRPQNL